MRAEVALIPEENLGVVILTNRGGTILPQPLAYKIFDAFLGTKEQKDWSAEMLKTMKSLEETGKAAAAKMEAERVKGTSPSFGFGKIRGRIHGRNVWRRENYVSKRQVDGKIRIEF